MEYFYDFFGLIIVLGVGYYVFKKIIPIIKARFSKDDVVVSPKKDDGEGQSEK